MERRDPALTEILLRAKTTLARTDTTERGESGTVGPAGRTQAEMIQYLERGGGLRASSVRDLTESTAGKSLPGDKPAWGVNRPCPQAPHEGVPQVPPPVTPRAWGSFVQLRRRAETKNALSSEPLMA